MAAAEDGRKEGQVDLAPIGTRGNAMPTAFWELTDLVSSYKDITRIANICDAHFVEPESVFESKMDEDDGSEFILGF